MSSVETTLKALSFPETVFPMGFNACDLPSSLRRRDAHRGLSLGSLLDSTPLHWVRLRAFRLAQRLVTNADYAKFALDGAGSEQGGAFEDRNLWQYVWTELGQQLGSHRGFSLFGLKSLEFVDDYNGCVNFVDAYIRSLKYELERILSIAESNVENQYSSRVIRKNFPELNEVFTFLKFKLRHVLILDDSEDWWASQGPKEQQILRELSNSGDVVEAVVTRLDRLTEKLSRIFASVLDPKLKQDGYTVQSVEALRFLMNFRNAIHCQAPEDRIWLRQILFPRSWRSLNQIKAPPSGGFRLPTGLKRRGGPVPWAERPVMNLTYYEALAYTAWLSNQHGWRRVFALPNEAQFERAASWPLKDDGSSLSPEPSSPMKKPRTFEISQKRLYPWGHSTGDYHDYFGKDGQTLNTVYADANAYHSLLNKTASWSEADRIDQLVGFGWQWTCDRFDSRMPRYERLRHLPRFQGDWSNSENAQNPVPEVYDYEENRHLDHCSFVVRGAPYHSGGPGLTTRRFALFPLRGYPDVGFRWVENFAEVP